MTNATEQQLPPELIPGNMGEIQERSQKRQEQWAKKLEELHSLRTPRTPSTSPSKATLFTTSPPRVMLAFLMGLSVGLSLGAVGAVIAGSLI